jgi:hypothetical protein
MSTCRYITITEEVEYRMHWTKYRRITIMSSSRYITVKEVCRYIITFEEYGCITTLKDLQ